MGFESQNIPSLLNGVSQQPPVLRHPTQGETQENCLSDLAVGLKKRPAFKHLTTLNMSATQYVHFFENTFDNDTDVFAAVFTSGRLRCYRLDGNTAVQMTVNTASTDVEFLSGATASGRGTDPLSVPLWANVSESITYDITISGTATVQVNEYDSDGTLLNTLDTISATGTGTVATAWDNTKNGSYLGVTVSSYSSGNVSVTLGIPDEMYLPGNPRDRISAVTIADYTFIASTERLPRMSPIADGGTLTGTKQTFGELPTSGVTDGDVYKILGDESTNFDDYYVYANGASPNTLWTETVEPTGINNIEDCMMPHVLVRTAATTFEFRIESWNDRIAGDDESAPEPSFMGKPIQDLTFYRDRLGVLAGEGLTLSRVGTAPGGYFAFFPESVQHVLDSDPIDVKATRNAGGDLFAGIPFNENLLLFSNQAQFIMNPNGVLTPETARVDPTTSFAATPNAKPVAVGNNVYFSVSAGEYAQIREYFVTEDGTQNDAADITSHVPMYIPATVRQITGTTSRDIIAVNSDGDVSAIYVYKYFWDGDQKKQSSWSKFTLPSHWTVLSMAMLDEKFQLAVHDTEATTNNSGILMEMSFDVDDNVPTVNGIPVHLDAVAEVTSAIHSAGTTTLTWANCEVAASDFTDWVAVVNDSGSTSGEVLSMTRTSATTATVSGDYSGVDNIYVGFKYNQKYTFSEQFIKRPTGTVQTALPPSQLTGRLQLRKFMIRYKDSTAFTAGVTSGPRTEVTYSLDADTEAGGAVAGTVHQATGTFTVPIYGRSDDLTLTLTNEEWTPATWLTAEWVGVFSQRPVKTGRRTTAYS